MGDDDGGRVQQAGTQGWGAASGGAARGAEAKETREPIQGRGAGKPEAVGKGGGGEGRGGGGAGLGLRWFCSLENANVFLRLSGYEVVTLTKGWARRAS